MNLEKLKSKAAESKGVFFSRPKVAESRGRPSNATHEGGTPLAFTEKLFGRPFNWSISPSPTTPKQNTGLLKPVSQINQPEDQISPARQFSFGSIADCAMAIQECFERCEVENPRNLFVSILSGFVFALAWWIAIDAASIYSTDQLPGAYHTPGVFGTIAFVLVNMVPNSADCQLFINTSTLTPSISRYEQKNYTVTGLWATWTIKKPNDNQRTNGSKGRNTRKTIPLNQRIKETNPDLNARRKRPNHNRTINHKTVELNTPNKPTRHKRLTPGRIHKGPIKLGEDPLQNYQMLF
ncbi:transmembrane protein 50B [Clonorchis sinensis]|uniref:Transmembrane protein 50B n=1 Tax=Clonorchis sinensis TaxID=79923 RepID=G7YAP0_CLOSI|nr:transmembrane protein 50B [Clonorchis sinensis]